MLLEQRYGSPKRQRLKDPFEMIVWENVAYLVDDDRRRALFNALRRELGIDPTRILDCPGPVLTEIIKDGGMQPTQRAAKLQRAARLTLEIGRAELRAAVRERPDDARRLLRKFPGIGEPGADKILLFMRSGPTLAPDSNGLRVLTRLGFCSEHKNYAATYRSALDATAPMLPRDFSWLIPAHLLLRKHGQAVCRRSEPHCGVCPLKKQCQWFRTRSHAGVQRG